MDNLVERLRWCARQCDQPTSDLYAIAADEIERLRALPKVCGLRECQIHSGHAADEIERIITPLPGR